MMTINHSDPTHSKNIAGKKIWDILEYAKNKTSITNFDCLRVKKYYGFEVKYKRERRGGNNLQIK